MISKRVCIALGGNALIQPGQNGTAAEQIDNCRVTAEQITKIIKAGYSVVLTHGNGPQVGAILLQNQMAGRAGGPPEMPLSVCGAESQGEIGYMFSQTLMNELAKNGVAGHVTCLLTQTEVSASDPAFQHPTKPVGLYMTEAAALAKAEADGCVVREEANGKGWRVVVPSPLPMNIVEREAINTLVGAGYLVIASGGGGIPVVRQEDGTLKGVEAVIDKDRSAAILAKQTDCEKLLILTNVSNAMINYRKADEECLGRVSYKRMQELVDAGHFAPGSMLPKIQSLMEFSLGGGQAILTSLDNAFQAIVEGNGCTQIEKD